MKILHGVGSDLRGVQDLPPPLLENPGQGLPFPHALAKEERIAQEKDIVARLEVHIAPPEGQVVVNVPDIVIGSLVTLDGMGRQGIAGQGLDDVESEKKFKQIDTKKARDAQKNDILRNGSHEPANPLAEKTVVPKNIALLPDS
jgi:hypothetical protein